MATGTSLVGNVKDLLGAADNKAARKVGGDMDKDAFLKLLVTQLKNQDPMKPMQDTEFIGQMAQFSSLEQMQNMNKQMEAQNNFAQLSQASSLIGKDVTLVTNGDDAQTITGVVDEIRQTGGETFVIVNGEAYDTSMIHTVGKAGGAAAPAATPATTTPAAGTSTAAASTTGTEQAAP